MLAPCHGLMLVQKVASRFVISDISSPEQTIQGIEQDIEFKGFNLWILVLSIFICSIGLNVDSTAVVIGAMLISPLMGPIMGVGLGIGIQAPDHSKCFAQFVGCCGISILTSALYFTISPIEEASKELLQGRPLRCSTLVRHCWRTCWDSGWFAKEKLTWCRVWP